MWTLSLSAETLYQMDESFPAGLALEFLFAVSREKVNTMGHLWGPLNLLMTPLSTVAGSGFLQSSQVKLLRGVPLEISSSAREEHRVDDAFVYIAMLVR